MNAMRIVALVLIIGGVVGLAYGGISYTQQNHEAKIGPIELSVSQKKTIDVPIWASIASVLVGAGLLLAGSKRR